MHIYLYFGIVLNFLPLCLHHSACILVSDDDVFSRGKKKRKMYSPVRPQHCGNRDWSALHVVMSQPIRAPFINGGQRGLSDWSELHWRCSS